MPIDSLKPAPWNPRLLRDERFKSLCESVKADPDMLRLRPVLAQSDGTIYAGNMRWRAVKQVGHTEVWAVVEDVPEQLAKERALRDNNNWGEWQDDELAELLASLQESGSSLDLLGFEQPEIERLLESVGLGDAHIEDGLYSRSVLSPVYIPTGECPAVSALADVSKARALISKIDAADLQEDVKVFLRAAAMRHVLFDYAAIAEFYAHADADVQDLMEQSALVILDIDRAIELGFAKLAEDIRVIAATAEDVDGE